MSVVEITPEELAEFDHERARRTDLQHLPPWDELGEGERTEWIESAALAMRLDLYMRRYRDAVDLLRLRRTIDDLISATEKADMARKIGAKRVPCAECAGTGIRFDLIDRVGYAPNCGGCATLGYRDDTEFAEKEERVAWEELEEARKAVDL